MPRINYVCTLWTGPRRTDGDEPPDPEYYIKRQLIALEAQRHNLAQITFVLNRNDLLHWQRERDLAVIADIPERIQNTPIVIHTRPNVGLSYGAFNYAYQEDPDFDYYIFIEDDYVPVIDGFDHRLVRMFAALRAYSVPKLGYLCTYYAAVHPEYGPHAAISNGLISREALEAIQEFGAYTANYEEAAKMQIAFSRAFEKAGYGVRDFSHKYRAPFFDRHGIRDFAPQNFECLFVPVQMLDSH